MVTLVKALIQFEASVPLTLYTVVDAGDTDTLLPNTVLGATKV